MSRSLPSSPSRLESVPKRNMVLDKRRHHTQSLCTRQGCYARRGEEVAVHPTLRPPPGTAQGPSGRAWSASNRACAKIGGAAAVRIAIRVGRNSDGCRAALALLPGARREFHGLLQEPRPGLFLARRISAEISPVAHVCDRRAVSMPGKTAPRWRLGFGYSQDAHRGPNPERERRAKTPRWRLGFGRCRARGSLRFTGSRTIGGDH